MKKKSIPYLLLVTVVVMTTSGCRVLKYDQINLKRVNPDNFLERKLKKPGNFHVYIHNKDKDSTSHPIEIMNASIDQSEIQGKIQSTAESKIQKEYYTQLKEKDRKRNVFKRIESVYKRTELDQIHIWVNDSLYESMYNEIRINTNQVLAIEKVKKHNLNIYIWIAIFVAFFTMFAVALSGPIFVMGFYY